MLFILLIKSAIVSVILPHHEDLVTPGISPFEASSLKQIRQRPNCLMKPRGRPHFPHLLIILVENLGFFSAFKINAFLAIILLI